MRSVKAGRALLYNEDCLKVLRELRPESVNCCITSPPYWNLRNYGTSALLAAAEQNIKESNGKEINSN